MALKKPSELFYKKSLNEDYSPYLNTNSAPITSEDVENSSSQFFGILEDFRKNVKNLDRLDDLIQKVEEISEDLHKVNEDLPNKLTSNDLDNAMLSQLMLLDENFRHIQAQVKGLNRADLLEFKTGAKELRDIVDNLIENEIPKYKKLVSTTELKVEKRFEEFEDRFSGLNVDLAEKIDTSLQELNQYLEEFNFENRINDNTQNIEELKETAKELKTSSDAVEIYIANHSDDIINLREELLSEISNIPLETLNERINKIQEEYEKLKDNVQQQLNEGLLNEPPDTKNEDPLTPLDHNFVTIDQLNDHYRLFINRVQQQLSTLGGGGETQLKYLDDIVGIATNASAYDGKYLKYDHSIGKFIFVGINSDDDSWVDNTSGTYTLANVGINTNDPQFNLDVAGDINFTGTFYQNGSPFVASRWTAGTGDDIYRPTGNVGIGTDNPTGTLDVNGNIVGVSATFTGDSVTLGGSVLSIPDLTNFELTNYGVLGVGRTVGFEDTDIVAHFGSDVDSYAQIIIQNHNTGTLASADIVVNNNQEEGYQIYGNLGINGSGYEENPYDPFTVPNGTYVVAAGGPLTIGPIDNYYLNFACNGLEILRMIEDGGIGYVGIASTTPTERLDVDGNAKFSGTVVATDFNSASDIGLKKNVKIVDNPIDKVMKLEGVSFTWKETGKDSLGVIAQQIETVLPELVSGENTKTVNYNGLIGLLIECVKNQQEQIEELKKLIDK